MINEISSLSNYCFVFGIQDVEDEDDTSVNDSNYEFSAYLTVTERFPFSTMSTVLSFVSGPEEITPLGFPHNATLGFSEINPYPTVSTGTIQLSYASFQVFYI